MSPPRIDLKQLASFVVACQNPTIGESAGELGVSASTLSVSLHALEQNLDLKLFHRKGSYLSPLPAAFWLFQQATVLLHAESHTRAAVAGPSAPTEFIHIRIDLSFTMGRFSKALGRTIELMRQATPEIAFAFDFHDSHGDQGPDNLVDALGHPASADVEIGYLATKASQPVVPLHDDPWVSVSLADKGDAGPSVTSRIVPFMHPTLRDQVTAYCEQGGLGHRLIFSDMPPVDLAELLTRSPGARFLMPRSMVGDRLGLGNLHFEPLDPPLHSQISARVSGQLERAAEAFLTCLQGQLRAPEANVVFDPALTARQIHYFNLIQQTGSLSTAARTAHVSQPTISAQIKRLETALSQPLFLRSRLGMSTTEAGRRLVPLMQDLEDRLNRILSGRKNVAAHTQSAVAIGLLPSSGHDSVMTALVAKALSDIRARFPDCSLQVSEGSNADLHTAVRAGELNLAVVGSVLGLFPRVNLGPSERLSLVANPSLGLGGRTEISLAETCSLPLVLGPQYLSIHNAFVRSAADRRLTVNQVMVAGSIPLAIAMARTAPLCTVLPASSVRHDLDLGRLTATPIADDLSVGTLSVIYSGDRTLSDTERALVRALVAAFAAPMA